VEDPETTGAKVLVPMVRAGDAVGDAMFAANEEVAPLMRTNGASVPEAGRLSVVPEIVMAGPPGNSVVPGATTNPVTVPDVVAV